MNKRWLNQKGFSLVSVMMASAVGGIVMYGIASVMQNMTKEQNEAFIRNARADIGRLIRQVLADPNAITQSLALPENLAAKLCVEGDLTNPSNTQACVSGSVDQPNEMPFILVNNTGDRQITGTPKDPLHYDNMGAPCNDGRLCPLKVSATFVSRCQVGTSCGIGQNHEIRYLIQLNREANPTMSFVPLSGFWPLSDLENVAASGAGGGTSISCYDGVCCVLVGATITCPLVGKGETVSLQGEYVKTITPPGPERKLCLDQGLANHPAGASCDIFGQWCTSNEGGSTASYYICRAKTL